MCRYKCFTFYEYLDNNSLSQSRGPYPVESQFYGLGLVHNVLFRWISCDKIVN